MPRRPTMRPLALAALAGVVYWAAQPPLAAGMLAFVALVPLLLAVRDATPLRGAALGWLAGTIACNGLTSASIRAALLRAGHPGWLAAAEALVVPQLCGALYFAAFGAFVALLQRRRPGTPWRVVLVPAAWVAGELARSRIGDGMPWVLLAHAVVGLPDLLQVADLAGAYGVSFVVALVNVLVALLIERPLPGWDRLRLPVAVAAGILVAVVVYGRAQLVRWRDPGGTPIRVALVQGNIPDAWRSSLGSLPAVLARYQVSGRPGGARPARARRPARERRRRLTGDELADARAPRGAARRVPTRAWCWARRAPCRSAPASRPSGTRRSSSIPRRGPRRLRQDPPGSVRRDVRAGSSHACCRERSASLPTTLPATRRPCSTSEGCAPACSSAGKASTPPPLGRSRTRAPSCW